MEENICEDDNLVNLSDKSDSEIIKECERTLQSMRECEEDQTRCAEKRKDREEDYNSDDGFITITRRRSKRLLRSDSATHKNLSNDVMSTNSERIHEICMTSLNEFPKQMAMARMLRNENITGIVGIKYKSPYKIFIRFKSELDADKLLNCKKFEEMNYRVRKTLENRTSYGLIKGVDLDMTEKELLDILECEYEIQSVKRLKRMNENGKWVDSESIRMCFKSTTLPQYVVAYGCRMQVSPFVFPVTQCSGCWKFGHSLKFCPTKKMTCPKCGSSKHSNCEMVNLKCLNCKGSHFVLDKACPFFLKEKEIRLIMSKGNITYKKALQVLANFNQPEKDHNFTICQNNETQEFNPVQNQISVHYDKITTTDKPHEANITLDSDEEESEDLNISTKKQSRKAVPMKKKTKTNSILNKDQISTTKKSEQDPGAAENSDMKFEFKKL
ncbi:uncharacterized protein LOC125075603 [Vanessa atalanta]|uniref:uncharacterized protein LOC125075603 n=1 Tax=Vanessa atalanta TaxID=42275 RepID=UPI001FCE0B0B|nr:uncharacterized protein LOC125075603 [Vanessa atalanta]